MIVVDDGSPVPVAPVVERYANPLNVRVVRQENAGPAAARNTGAGCATGNYLVFLDDDCALASDYLCVLAHCCADHPDSMIGGCTVNSIPANLFASASQLMIDYFYEGYGADAPPTFFTSNNLALPKKLFHAVGGFDTTFPLAAGEDRELCDRWLAHGLPMTYAPDAKVSHAHAMTLVGFWRQHVTYGRGSYHFHRLRARRRRETVRLERLSFYVELLRYPLRRGRGTRAWRLLGLMALSQGANAVGFLRARFSAEHRTLTRQTSLSSKV